MNSSENPFLSFEKTSDRQLPFGREEVVREIFGSINKPQGAECFSLVGAKYLGKSQILRSIIRTSTQNSFLALEVMDRSAFLYFDCGDFPSNREETFRRICVKVIRISLQKWGLDFKQGLALEYSRRLTKSNDIFEILRAFEGILTILARYHGKSIIFILDDFQYMLEYIVK